VSQNELSQTQHPVAHKNARMAFVLRHKRFAARNATTLDVSQRPSLSLLFSRVKRSPQNKKYRNNNNNNNKILKKTPSDRQNSKSPTTQSAAVAATAAATANVAARAGSKNYQLHEIFILF